MRRPINEADPIDIFVGHAVRGRRRTLGVSQERLAEQLGLSFQQVQKYENGANRISASKLANIAAALNAPIESFFPCLDAEREPEPIGPTQRLAGVTGGLELAEAFLEMPPQVRTSLLSVARALRGVTIFKGALHALAED